MEISEAFYLGHYMVPNYSFFLPGANQMLRLAMLLSMRMVDQVNGVGL
jgi:hypothetical protein